MSRLQAMVEVYSKIENELPVVTRSNSLFLVG